MNFFSGSCEINRKHGQPGSPGRLLFLGGHVKNITICLLAAAVVCGSISPVAAQGRGIVTASSEFVMELAMPGAVDHFLRPGRVFYDPAADEIFVSDEGKNRLVIFSSNGAYKFEFALAGHVGAIIDFAVSPSGYIYVLGSTQEGRALLTFDFDGLYLGDLCADPSVLADMEPTSITVGADGRLFVLDTKVPQIVRMSAAGTVETRFPIEAQFDEDKTGNDLIMGALAATDDGILVPLSSYGMVFRYTAEGRKVTSYGHKGTTTGELGFPVSASVAPNGMVSVLDKQRFAILCFAPDGKCLGEFGGKGSGPGWFYYPSYLTFDGTDQLFISQVFNNRVQVCRIPAPIRDNYDTSGTEPSHGQINDKTANNGLVDHIQHITTQGGL